VRPRYPSILALTLALVFGMASRSFATNFGYTAVINGLDEVPANASPGTGLAILVYDDVANTLTINVQYSGLVGTVSAAHIHGPAAPGFNAGVVHGFTFPASPVNDVWSGLTPAQVGYLNNGQLYVNIHSSAFPAGEIRGNISSSPTPARSTSWGRIKSLYR